jgi:ATP synthase I chain
MTEKGAGSGQGAALVVSGVVRKTAIITAVGLAGAVALQATLWPDLPFWTVPAGVVFGGVLGVVNFRWLAAAVERVYLRQGASGALSQVAAAVITVLKLSTIFVVIFVAIKWSVVNIFGLVAGLTFCFLAILWQGLSVMNAGPEGQNDRLGTGGGS